MRQSPEDFRQAPVAASGASPIAAHVARLGQNRFARGSIIAGLLGVFLAYLGPFGSYEVPFGQRLAYWGPGMVAGGLMGTAIAATLASRPRFSARPWRMGVITWLLVSAVGTLVFWGWGELVFGRGRMGSLLGFAPGVFIMGAAVTALMFALIHPSPFTHAAPAAAGIAPPPARARFFARLPAELQAAELYAVSAEDHYLRVRTSAGERLILLRLSDAIAELEGIEGAQVHRSWWVARGGYHGAVRNDGKLALRLRDGTLAPVSRPNVRPLRDAGWL